MEIYFLVIMARFIWLKQMTNNIQETICFLPSPSGRYQGQGLVYLARPSQIKYNDNPKLVIALHGSGRGALSYRDIPFYKKQRDIALSCGYFFASVSNGPDTFGLDNGLYNVEKLYGWVSEKFQINEKVVLWASSAGGIMMHRFFRLYPERVSSLFGIFPIFDPTTMPPLPSLLQAFAVTDYKAMLRKVRNLNLDPAQFPSGVYSGKQVIVAHGTDDEVVPISQSLSLEKYVRRDKGEMALVEKHGGHSTSNFSLYDTPLFHLALQENMRSC